MNPTRTVHKVDATGRVLGRLATEIATLLRGKNKVGFTAYQDNGDEVVVSNPQSIIVTGKKLTDKFYYRHSTYPGSLKKESLGQLLARKPEQVIVHAVKNMLPKNRLAPKWLARLKFETKNAK